MARTQHRQWKNRHKLINIPTPRNKPRISHYRHPRYRQKAQCYRIFESFCHFGNFNEEVGEFDFFGGGAPRHVNAEHVAEEGLGDM